PVEMSHGGPAAPKGDSGGELLAQGGLADARLADDHHQATLTRKRAVERLLDLLQLRLAADEGWPIERMVAGRRAHDRVPSSRSRLDVDRLERLSNLRRA